MTDKFSTENTENGMIQTEAATPQKPHKENMFVNILMNVAIPTLILMKLSSEKYLGPTLGLIIALAFPIGYGIYDYLTVRKFNFFSALGIVSVLLTGGISLLHLDTKYYAMKEALIPSLIGLIVIGSTKTRYPLVKTFIYNDTILKVEKIAGVLKERNKEDQFERTLRNGSYLIAISFFLCAVLNYVLAKMIVVSPTGTPEYNAEIGKMHWLGFIVIAVPQLIIFILTLMYIFRDIRLLTDLTIDDIMHDDSEKK